MALRRIDIELPLTGICDGSIPGTKPSYVRDVVPYRGSLVTRGPRTDAAVSSTPTTLTSPDIRSLVYRGDAISNAEFAIYDAANGIYASTWPGWTKLSLPSYFGSVSVDVTPNGYAGWIKVGDELMMADSSYQSGGGTGFVRWAGNLDSSVSVASLSNTASGDSYITATTSVFTVENMYLTVASATTGVYHCRRILKVISGTKALLDAPIGEKITTRPGKITNLGLLAGSFSNSTATAGGGIFNVARYGSTTPANYSAATGPGSATLKMLIPNGRTAAYHLGRLFVGCIGEATYDGTDFAWTIKKNRIRWSGNSRDNDATNGREISYWHDSAYLDIDDLGGIVGLASFNGDLLVLCLKGIGIIRGDIASDGTYSGATWSVIDTSNGTFGETSWCIGTDGVYWLNQQGVFQWDGAKIVELTSSFSRSWRESYSTGFGIVRMSDIGDRIIVAFGGGGGHWECLSFIKGVGWFAMSGSEDANSFPTNIVSVVDGTQRICSIGIGKTTTSLTEWASSITGTVSGYTTTADIDGGVASPAISCSPEYVGSPYRVRESALELAADSLNVTAKVYEGDRDFLSIYLSGFVESASATVSVSNSYVPQLVRFNVGSSGFGENSSRNLSLELTATANASTPSLVSGRFFSPATVMLDVDDVMEGL